MDKLFGRLRIGEKIGLGFGLMAILFLAAIWQYHQGQAALIQDYGQLQSRFVARVNQAFAIQAHLHQARLAESRFLLERLEADAVEVADQADLLLELTQRLSADPELAATAQAMGELATTYRQGFLDIAEAWRVKGLDEDSGLQGAFRRSAHELQQRSRNFRAGELYVTLLQIRRGEKDLLLRGEAQYVQRVEGLIARFRDQIREAEFYPEVRQALINELEVYDARFWEYAQDVLAGNAVPGGKGPFRDAGHRLEAILTAHYVPGLETAILELRRREKDYLLRGDAAYVRQVGDIANQIRGQIQGAAIAAQDQIQLGELLDNYERDFLALVAKNDRIAELTMSINQAGAAIEPLARQNLEQADRDLAEASVRLATVTQAQGRINLLVVLGAMTLGILFTLLLTRRIVRPVREMAGLLDRLTHESPRERIATLADSRDEINAMAESLNTLADHRANFMHWWMAAMDEAKALRKLHESAAGETRDEALEELRRAALAQVQQLNSLRGQLLNQAERIAASGQRLTHGESPATVARDLEQSVNGIRTLLQVTA